jgi:hypothetical protein
LSVSFSQTILRLTVFRRHRTDCPHGSEGRSYRRRRLHAEGRLGGEKIRRVLATPNWEKTQDTVRQWEAESNPEPVEQREPVTISEAVPKFVAGPDRDHRVCCEPND